ncbi:TetR/AcrR family transcriptional regulator [Nocardia puris]|uniref:TetR/AcrR family transcriptional regulator n=1 Tax=Nocardia puris TaxID=208602 RepID=UPI00189361AC|nr:TetR/AcrR family transcriptional regulator [Nocardia puris]MBF6212100.1 TetR/AcrR family transcriptional regulator [Nocardia puris]MBF6367126.1 TetR/AcrR family transcriptional regulator [Nocardia puris]MBF6461897.1 TetR/AcrR family transcriptional regulator [Nocardia puris]
MADGTKDRIIGEALRLFADQGYAGTSVAAIEKAAGLSPHSGALYTHFASKEAVMAAAIDRAAQVAEAGFALAPMLPLGNIEAELTLVARGSLLLMDNWRNLIRVMMREFDQFPTVMAQARDRLFDGSYRFLAEWLAAKASGGDIADRDFEAITSIWLGALENYWVLCHVYDNPPFGMDEERFIRQWVDTLLDAIGARP